MLSKMQPTGAQQADGFFGPDGWKILMEAGNTAGKGFIPIEASR
jgi:hypothetical protein